MINANLFNELMNKDEDQPGNLLVCFDVKSLSTNIPIDETLKIIKNKYSPVEYVIDLTKLIFKQTEGAPIGSPL